MNVICKHLMPYLEDSIEITSNEIRFVWILYLIRPEVVRDKHFAHAGKSQTTLLFQENKKTGACLIFTGGR